MPAVRAVCQSGTIILLSAVLLLGAPGAWAAQGRVGLGTADSFAVLAGSGITNTGPTTITGDVGSFPTPTQTGFGSVTLDGANHGGDAVTQQAKNDLISAYDDAAGRQPVTNVPAELGGSTLRSGVYTAPTFGLTGTLSLDAEGDSAAQFIFQAGSTLTAATDSRVLLLNGADPCRIVWQIGSSATFNAGTAFAGDVLAHTSISALTGATFRGRLLARNGAVTLDTNTIRRATCAAPSAAGDPVTSTTTAGTATAAPSGVSGVPSALPTTPEPGIPGRTTTTGGNSGGGGSAGTGDSGGAGSSDRVSAGPTGGPPSTSSVPLASTGAPTAPLLAAGLGLVATGAAALAAGRKRGPAAPDAGQCRP